MSHIHSHFKIRGQFDRSIQTQITDIHEKLKSQKGIFVFEDKEIEIPSNICFLSVTICGGGGAGSSGVIKKGVFYAGGGGGGGYSYIKKPIILINPNHDKIRVSIKIGKGGTFNIPDGGETSVRVFVDTQEVFFTSAAGGKGGTSISGGEGGGNSDDIFAGLPGKKGTVTIARIGSVIGGQGGSSIFGHGGLGGNQILKDEMEFSERKNETSDLIIKSNKDNPQGLDGTEFGSGGGGSVPGIEEGLVGNGAPGFAIIEF